MRKFIYILVLSSFIFGACNKKEKESNEGYDRTKLIHNISDLVIMPSYNEAFDKINKLKLSVAEFNQNTNASNLTIVQNDYIEAYKSWVKISTYEFGPAESVILRQTVNSFPTDTVKINENRTSGVYDLNLSANFFAKGFPALDFLLFKNDNNTTLEMLKSNSNNLKYIVDITNDVYENINFVVNKWQNSYLNEFKSMTGTDAGAALSLLVNQMSFELELARRDRVGNSLGYVGLINTGTTYPSKAEGFYANISKDLLLTNLTALKKLYQGDSGEGLDDYLRFLKAEFNGKLLADEIDTQFDIAIAAVNDLSPDLNTALKNDKAKVETAFVEIKKLIVLIKVDMASRLGVVISYQDNDGD